MRMLSMVLTAMALLQVAGWAEAKDRTQPGGGGYVDTKHPKLGKNYYVVRMGVGDMLDCLWRVEQQASRRAWWGPLCKQKVCKSRAQKVS
jgi:hypothetical protein